MIELRIHVLVLCAIPGSLACVHIARRPRQSIPSQVRSTCQHVSPLHQLPQARISIQQRCSGCHAAVLLSLTRRPSFMISYRCMLPAGVCRRLASDLTTDASSCTCVTQHPRGKWGPWCPPRGELTILRAPHCSQGVPEGTPLLQYNITVRGGCLRWQVARSPCRQHRLDPSPWHRRVSQCRQQLWHSRPRALLQASPPQSALPAAPARLERDKQCGQTQSSAYHSQVPGRAAVSPQKLCENSLECDKILTPSTGV